MQVKLSNSAIQVLKQIIELKFEMPSELVADYILVLNDIVEQVKIKQRMNYQEKIEHLNKEYQLFLDEKNDLLTEIDKEITLVDLPF